jgi:hypothetical protein
MDTSEQFRKMCEKAEEIQQIYRKWLKEECGGRTGVTISSKNGILDNYAVTSEGKFLDKDASVWLPRQDELQEMLTGVGVIAGDWQDVLWEFTQEMFDFFDEHRVGYYKCFTSMEQLWLAFVMKERWNKLWEKGDWIESTEDE